MEFRKNLQIYTFNNWAGIIISTIIVIFVYFFMEWIFLVTKPSFMSPLNILGQISIFFQTASFVTVIYFVLMIIFVLAGSKMAGMIKKIIVFAGLLIPGFLTASLLLLLVDNFSYTVFQFGIVNSTSLVRILYGILFLALVIISVKEVNSFISKIVSFLEKFNKNKIIIFSLIFLVIFIIVGVFPFVNNLNSINLPVLTASIKKSPHIFLITADGVNAESMSLYGYNRETTPFLEEMAKDSLVAQNAFSNSGSTCGSIVSMLTGKYPIDTRVLYPPNKLNEGDSYQHLPAILKMNGYTTSQFSVKHYVDAYQLNFKNGFDLVNGRSNQRNSLVKINQLIPNDFGFFLYEASSRIIDRLLHIFFIKQMPNPIKNVSSPENYNDLTKLESALQFLDKSRKPVFIHIHWMGTHGATFMPKMQVFSEGHDLNSQNDWEVDFYDDSILDFDQSMKYFYDELDQRGVLNESIIIIASDHGQKFVTTKRLPLIIKFPNNDFQGSVDFNVQNLDIAPTILDYLGITKPDWMAGNSLLKDDLDSRNIFGVGVGKTETGEEGNVISESYVKPPFYQFGYVSIIKCNTWYKLNLVDFSWSEDKISGYVGDCSDQTRTKNQILKDIISFFDSYNYDTTSIRGLLE